MAYKFNPTTGKLDTVADPGGSDTHVQFNDGSGFGGVSDLTYNKTTKVLTNKGDVNLDDGGSFTTTLQTITPTANRTISLPNATGTVALVGGSSGQFIYNNAGALGGTAALSIDGSGNITQSTGVYYSPLGTAAAPPVSFSGDPNTGIYSPGADQVAISTNGTSRLFVDATGRVGIGTSAPSALLHARGSASTPSAIIHLQPDNNTVSNYITFRNATDATRGYIEYNYASDYLAFASANAERFRCDSSGRLLVGTSAGFTFSTNSSSGVSQLQLVGVNTTDETASFAIVHCNQGGTARGPSLVLAKNRSSSTSLGTVLNEENLGEVVFQGSAGSAFVRAASIISNQDGGTPSATSMAGRLVFSTTANGASTPTERMRIGSDGLITIAGPGIKFPAAQVASADPNTLDDYEEGTFTPTVIGSSTAGTATYTNQTGIYTKIGRQVNWLIYVNWTGGTGSGNLQISGLPFTSANISSVNSWSVSFGIVDNIAVAANTQLNGYVSNNSSVVVLTNQVVGGGAYFVQAYDAAGHLLISGSYAAT